MGKTLRVRAYGKTGRIHGMRGKRLSLATKNAILSAEIDALRSRDIQPVLKVD